MKTILSLSEPLASYWKNQDPFFLVAGLPGKIYREVANRRTVEFMVHNQYYFAKNHRGVGWTEILKNIVSGRLPILSAKNEWFAIKKLQAIDIDCPECVGFGLTGNNPANLNSFIITKALVNTVSLEDFCMHWPTEKPAPSLKNQLIDKIASISQLMHKHGVIHRDFYLCHFLLDKKSLAHGAVKLSLIDLHRTLLLKKSPKRWLIKDLSSLYFSALDIGLTKRDFLRFIKKYSAFGLRYELRKNVQFWKQIEKKAIGLYLKMHQRQPKLVTSAS